MGHQHAERIKPEELFPGGANSKVFHNLFNLSRGVRLGFRSYIFLLHISLFVLIGLSLLHGTLFFLLGWRERLQDGSIINDWLTYLEGHSHGGPGLQDLTHPRI